MATVITGMLLWVLHKMVKMKVRRTGNYEASILEANIHRSFQDDFMEKLPQASHLQTLRCLLVIVWIFTVGGLVAYTHRGEPTQIYFTD